jgi:hypothetical protein
MEPPQKSVALKLEVSLEGMGISFAIFTEDPEQG